MSSLSSLTVRDIDIVRTLTLRARVATLSQIARVWWPASSNAASLARRRLSRLAAMELITGERLTVVVPRQLLHPMCHWQPDVPQPDLGQIAWLLSRRAKGQSVSQGLYWATPAAARRFGGVRSGQINRPFQIDHDLGVLEMFFAVRKLRPQLAESWIDEERLAAYRRHQKLPDAIVAVKPSAPPQLVLEYGGNYSKYRLQDFHEDNRERGLPYEIW